MTTLVEKSYTCCVCRSTNTFYFIGSTNRSGAPDLDTRPPESIRSTIAHWIQRCPACGYCAPDVSQSPLALDKLSEVIGSGTYLAQNVDRNYSELANSFLCWSIVLEAARNYPESGWAAAHAAWVCDDKNDGEGSDACRRRAITLFRIAQAHEIRFSANDNVEAVILADLLRRCGMFEDVVAVCKEGLAENPDIMFKRFLLVQLGLAKNHDRARHTVDEVIQTDFGFGV
jgi:hypothetical protein